jgi:hypothetical protein
MPNTAQYRVNAKNNHICFCNLSLSFYYPAPCEHLPLEKGTLTTFTFKYKQLNKIYLFSLLENLDFSWGHSLKANSIKHRVSGMGLVSAVLGAEWKQMRNVNTELRGLAVSVV